jgi:hypothetical protein
MEKVNKVSPRKEMGNNLLLVAAFFWGSPGKRETVLDFLTTLVSVCFPKWTVF